MTPSQVKGSSAPSAEPQNCPQCGNAYLAIRTDIYKDAREFVYCDACGCLADRRVWNRIATATQGAPTPAQGDAGKDGVQGCDTWEHKCPKRPHSAPVTVLPRGEPCPACGVEVRGEALPEQRRLPEREGSTYFRALGWNECLDEVRRLRAAGVAVLNTRTEGTDYITPAAAAFVTWEDRRDTTPHQELWQAIADAALAAAGVLVRGEALPVAWARADGEGGFCSAADKERMPSMGGRWPDVAKLYTVPLYAHPPAGVKVLNGGQQ